MAYLEIGLEPQAITRADDPNLVVGLDYAHVALANTLAQRAFDNPDATKSEKDLADAVHSLVGVLTELFSGLHHGRVGIENYPGPGAHLK